MAFTEGEPQLPPEVGAGDVLDGKYRVERLLGVGGMGMVVAAHHIHLDDKVAIKFLLPHMLSDAQAVSRFAHEARSAVKIKSEYVARVFDVGALQNGTPYMVMEFLEGEDLAAWLSQRGALGLKQAVELVLQACVAVAEAHSMGIVHRDLKPANLFCVRRSDGQFAIKVLDFGISKMVGLGGAVSGPATKITTGFGSPYYMSPEQTRSSKEVGPSTDIWAMGVILYELLTNRIPFPGATIAEVALKVTQVAPPSPRVYRPELPEALDAVVLRCLDRDLQKRYASIAEFAQALLPFGPPSAKALVDRIAGIIDSAAGSVEGAGTAITSVPPGAETQSASGAFARFGRGAMGPARRAAVVALVVGIAMLLVALPLALRRHYVPRAQAAARASSELPAATPPTSPPPETPDVLPTPTDLPKAPLKAPSLGQAAAKTAPRPAASARARNGSAKTNCRIVTFFDSDGDQHFKQDCSN
jgi:serine/threonine-protein kinase